MGVLILTSEHSHPNIGYRISAFLGFRNDTNAFWYYVPREGLNFGDWVGPYLFQVKTGNMPYRYLPKFSPFATSLFMAGSILHRIKAPNNAIVWGSGAISENIKFPKPRKIISVRGPLTRKVCLAQGHECPENYGDPAILLPSYYAPSVTQETKVGIIPHYTDWKLANRFFSHLDGVKIIDVRRDIEEVLKDIASCEQIVSSSLHGLIVAYSYNIPAGWIELTGNLRGAGFKFHDYYLSAGIEVQRPTLLSGGETLRSFQSIVNSYPQPNLSYLRSSLLDTCPF